jgi:hypothetical protein
MRPQPIDDVTGVAAALWSKHVRYLTDLEAEQRMVYEDYVQRRQALKLETAKHEEVRAQLQQKRFLKLGATANAEQTTPGSAKRHLVVPVDRPSSSRRGSIGDSLSRELALEQRRADEEWRLQSSIAALDDQMHFLGVAGDAEAQREVQLVHEQNLSGQGPHVATLRDNASFTRALIHTEEQRLGLGNSMADTNNAMEYISRQVQAVLYSTHIAAGNTAASNSISGIGGSPAKKGGAGQGGSSPNKASPGKVVAGGSGGGFFGRGVIGGLGVPGAGSAGVGGSAGRSWGVVAEHPSATTLPPHVNPNLQMTMTFTHTPPVSDLVHRHGPAKLESSSDSQSIQPGLNVHARAHMNHFGLTFCRALVSWCHTCHSCQTYGRHAMWFARGAVLRADASSTRCSSRSGRF